MAKKCTKCDFTKESEEFYSDKSKNDGLSTQCKTCINAAHKSRYTPKPIAQQCAFNGCQKQFTTSHNFIMYCSEVCRQKANTATCEHCGNEYLKPNQKSVYCSRKCSANGRVKSDTDEFVAEARRIHGNKYDYRKSVYKGTTHLITITCPKHGDWQTHPRNHTTLKCGCNVCGYEAASTKLNLPWDEWLQKARSLHCDFYDYSKAKKSYVNGESLLTLICPRHGEFQQRACKHLLGGCMECGGRKQLTCEEFVSKSRKVHGDKYDYTRSNYINNAIAVEIICPTHGSFMQIPASHMAGANCRKCVGAEKYTVEMFVEASKKVHGDKYDYSLILELNTLNDRVTIICPEHGKFTQKAASHKNGMTGCVKCIESQGEKTIRLHLVCQNIESKQEVRFPSCKNIKVLPFDFMVKTGNKSGFLIEYQGNGHYYKGTRSRNNRKNYRSFMGVQVRDHKKLQWCRQHNVPLLIIPYWDYNRIPEILDDVLAGRTPTFSEPPEIVKKYEPMRKKIRDHLGIKEPEVLCGLIKPELKEKVA